MLETSVTLNAWADATGGAAKASKAITKIPASLALNNAWFILSMH